jgi:tripartite-type tricarboxylate transporter receptor subunit TctC
MKGRIVVALGLWCGAVLPAGAADTYPTRPVRVLVPFAAGGPTDMVARVLGQRLAARLGQSFVVENRVGAGGNIAMALAAKAPPDGYTLLAVSSSFVVNASLYANAPYDPFKDFAPITCAVDAPNLLSVNPALPAGSVQELIRLIKANPGKYGMATSGIGTTPHLAGELFRLSFGLELVNVPFNGASPALQSTMQGQTALAITSMGNATELVRAGQLRALAVLADKRSPALPDVPTIVEAGMPNQESDTLQGLLAPAGTPPAIIALLYREVAAVLAEPAIRGEFETMGFETVATTPDEFGAVIRRDVAKWAKVIHAANVRVE